MSAIDTAPTTASEPESERRRAGLLEWLTTTNHKQIGILYIVTTFVFFLLGGLLALIMRTELAHPGLQILSKAQYNQVFTIHGTTMIFLFIAPMGLGLANYFVPLQIGAPDMAFPRLNMLSYWMLLFGGLTIYASFLAPGGAAETGWTFYVPLSDKLGSPGVGADMWIMGIILVSTSSIMTGVNLMATIFMLRAPGMTMWRLPLFCWNMIITSLMILLAFPPLTGALALLFIDRHFGGHFFDPSSGGSVILYQHLFWFFGHPEVYIMILPFFGIVTDIIPVFSRKPIFGYTGFVFASIAIAGLSMTVWAHHMFTTGAVLNPFFSFMSFLIAVPTGIKFFNWIGTMWGGSIRLSTPMLWCIGFMVNFLIGGITGVMIASAPFDYAVQDTYFIVAHMHYVLGGGSLFAIFAAIYYWFPKMTGYLLNERLGKVVFALTFFGFNLTFWPMHILGLRGMPRRVADYPTSLGPGASLTTPNLVATLGSYVMTIGALLFIWNVIKAFRDKVPAGNDPWGGYTLEWYTTSPPPEHNFTSLPQIRSERPVFDWRHRGDPAVEEPVGAPR
ncbi:MAG TPA: cytochrome c oxidase subunit I [Actinomycetota bacterium]|nr:cytochrome c oxidase subunit I [Actinomycetota bacterium]